jgi:hypothetical protein
VASHPLIYKFCFLIYFFYYFLKKKLGMGAFWKEKKSEYGQIATI